MLAYFLIVVPVLAVVTAAVWPPRPGSAALILAGPLITLAAVAGIPLFEQLGWLAVIGVPYAVLVVPPVLNWRRPWATVLVPGTVLVICGGFMIVSRGEAAVVFYLSLPVILAAGALARVLFTRFRRSVDIADPSPPSVP